MPDTNQHVLINTLLPLLRLPLGYRQNRESTWEVVVAAGGAVMEVENLEKLRQLVVRQNVCALC